MNRGGLAGAAWEIDDRFTAYDTAHLRAANLDAGKMLLRIDDDDAGTVADARRRAARAVQELNDAEHDGDGRADPVHQERQRASAVWDTDPLALVRAVGVSAALGGSSAYTWLKIQATADIATVAGGDDAAAADPRRAPGPDPEATFASWEAALHEPTVRGLVVGRALLYPADGDVAGAVSACRRLRRAGRKGSAMRLSHCIDPPAPWPTAISRGAGPGRRRLDVLRACSSSSLAPGVERSIDLGDSEAVVLPLSATDVDGRPSTISGFALDGRTSVFARVTDFAYAPLGADVAAVCRGRR